MTSKKRVLESLQKVIDYLGESENADFTASTTAAQSGHIFRDLEIIKSHLELERGGDFIEVRWYAEDVLARRPDLSSEQAMRVLGAVESDHDSDVGINLDVIEFWANELFAKTVVHEEMGRRVWVSQEMALLEKLMDVIPELEQWLENHDGSELIKLAATGYEDLTVELLERNGEEARISLGHYRMNAEGKFVSDPSVIIELNLERKMAQTVRLESDGKCWWNALREPGCDQSLFAQLNCFLDDWLDTIQELGYEQKPEQRLELGL